MRFLFLLLLASCSTNPYLSNCSVFPESNDYDDGNMNGNDNPKNRFQNSSNSELNGPFASMLLSQLQNYNVTTSCDYNLNPQVKKPLPSAVKMMDQDYPD